MECSVLEQIEVGEVTLEVEVTMEAEDIMEEEDIMEGMHTVAIWTFTFHKISGFVRVILKANFKEFYRPKVSIF